MIELDVRADIKAATQYLTDLERRQIPFATARALNTVAFNAMRAGREYLQANIDRPTPFTVKSWYVRRKATKTKLVAVVGWSDFVSQKRIGEGGKFAGAEYYLSQHWTGGPRKMKAFERQLQRRGILPAGMQAVPGEAADDLGMIDRYGNMKGPVLVAILSAVGSLDEMGYNANATVRQSKRLGKSKAAAKRIYWAGKPGKNTPNGIWMIDEKHSKRGRLRPVIVFVKPGQYKRRLNIDAVSSEVQRSGFREAFDKELAHAIRTAK